MKLKIFNAAIALFIVCLMASSMGFAQEAVNQTDNIINADSKVDPVETSTSVNIKAVKINLRKLKTLIKNCSIQANTQVIAAVNNLNTVIAANIDQITPQINTAFNDVEISTSVSSNKNTDDADLIKNYSKSYSADANDALSIENRYGNVTVNTWNKNEIKVDVQIKVSAGSEDAAQKLLDNVTISDAKNGSSIAFRTNIGETKNSWYSVFQGGSSRKMEINYTVYMPAKNDLTIDNRYGATELPDMSGKVTVRSAYGSFKSGALSNESAVSVKYGNATMGNLGNCALYLSYGNIVMGTVNKLAANISYSGIKIDKINGSGSLNVRYGDGVDIGDLGRNMYVLSINISYSNVKIGLSGDEAANFDVTTHYGDFNYDEHNVRVTVNPPDDSKGPHFTKSYKGYIGKGAANNRYIAINANYGNVRFN